MFHKKDEFNNFFYKDSEKVVKKTKLSTTYGTLQYLKPLSGINYQVSYKLHYQVQNDKLLI